jgi:hypothetical protein
MSNRYTVGCVGKVAWICEERRGDPNENGAFQDDWQSDEDIAALDGMAIDGDGRLNRA